MLLIIFLLFSKMLFIKAEDNSNITIVINTNIEDPSCTPALPSYTFTEGEHVKFIIEMKKNKKEINHSWVRLLIPSGNDNTLFYNITEHKTFITKKSIAGTWRFQFDFLRDFVSNTTNQNKIIIHESHLYLEASCTANVIIIDKKDQSSQTSENNQPLAAEERKKYIITIAVLASVSSIIILAQSFYIIYLKTQAKKLDRYNNLSKKVNVETPPSDRARYCSNPGQMMKVAPIPEESDRDSVIYEAPHIEMLNRVPAQPPQPPAINTIPRTPRADNHLRIGNQPMHTSPLNTPTHTMEHPMYPRPNQAEPNNNMANRAPLPLPKMPPDNIIQHNKHAHDNNTFEVYEEMDTEDNTYEPPPIINANPPKQKTYKSVPTGHHEVPRQNSQKPVPTAHLLDVSPKPHNLRSSNKPPITRKPQTAVAPIQNELQLAFKRRNNEGGHQQHTGPQPTNNGTNELTEALRRRNKVMQVPIVSIPESNKTRGPSPKSNQRPPMASKPVSASKQEEIYYNDNGASSDEEWTYEPLQPFQGYDKDNIYNNV